MTPVRAILGLSMLMVFVATVTGNSGSCATSSDCDDSQCCVLPLRGRRKLLQMDKPYVCEPMPQKGQACIVDEDLVPGTRPEAAGVACPCPALTHCEPDGGQMIPQGPTGNCESDMKLKSGRS